MDLRELVDLISIRQYVCNSISNPTVDRPTLSELNGILILLDKKMIAMIKSPEFKEYVGYANVRQAIVDAAKITNIKSSLMK